MSNDRELLQRVRTELLLEPDFQIDRLQLHLRFGIVTLMGRAASVTTVRQAERAVRRTRGARAVINRLAVPTA